MKIHKLEYKDHEYQWELAPIEFSPNLNLLVGISGVGKTQILRAINQLKKITNGSSLNGVEWNIKFSTKDGSNYDWSGKFETKKNNQLFDDEDDGESNVGLLYEELHCNTRQIIQRTQEKIIFNDNKTPKLSPYQSLIKILEEEDIIVPVKEGFDKIFFTDVESAVDRVWRLPVSLVKKYENSNFKTLKDSDLPALIKLSLVNKLFPTNFATIKEIFIEIFPTVEDIRIESLSLNELPIAIPDANIVTIKEKQVSSWIRNISSGMLKTLMYISQIYLSPDDGVILIDEFENSLGVNCMDSVTDLITEQNNLQFILTSHHPYIINNISPMYWKIITREGGLVSGKDSEYFHIPKSRHKAFLKLLKILEKEVDKNVES
ncbi:AAA family ATPase [Spirulina sp. CS-785/01]|uniref:AAA family ATPase n=1 Tax=Spirulina sp. CS-785/01 TaxID=3021716 RepID=UPI00232D4CD5|nr:AAA family ATPase [Spirulina sp. CS-785/01]MDB9315844.1 AAA family ATPase [Spirulina sp. CS-785/01]